MAGRTPGVYEIPQEMREFADKSVEQARKAFDGFVGAAQRTVFGGRILAVSVGIVWV